MQREEVVQFIHSVLVKRFPDNLEKQRIDDSNDRKLNFACPICGDSHKKASKKRGNLYFDTEAYKCFNDGCMSYMSIGEFVARMSREFGLMLPSFIADIEYTPVRVKRTDNPLIHFMTSDTSELITISEVINRFSLKRLDDETIPQEVSDYLIGRNLHHVEDYGDTLYTDRSGKYIIIANFDKRSGRLLGFSVRAISKTAEKRYNIKSYSDLAQIFVQRDLDKDLIESANYLNNYFNILNIDFTKPISLTEGQFDSLFVNNCIATSGVSKARSILPSLGAKSGLRILFDRDKGGRNEMMTLIKQGYSILLWNRIIHDLKLDCQGSPRLLIKLSDIKDINDLYSFIRAHLDPMPVLEFNKWLDGYFSKDVFDIAYL